LVQKFKTPASAGVFLFAGVGIGRSGGILPDESEIDCSWLLDPGI
jgi:hypothetical protein